MTRGRKPKPTALKLIDGNPGKRPINGREPRFAAELPEPPAFLDAEGRREWNRIALELYQQGVLTGVDRAALAAYCSWWSLFVKASTEMEEFGLMQTSESGYESPSGWVNIKKQASEQMHKFMTEFGLTPSSRSRIKLPDKAQEDDPLLLFNRSA